MTLLSVQAAFAAYWTVFCAVVEAEALACTPWPSYPLDEDERCDIQHTRDAARNTALGLNDTLRVARGVYEAAKRPAGPDRAYFVSAVKGGEYVLLAGPFEDVQDALLLVPTVRALVCENNREGVWWSYGTCAGPRSEHGAANDLLLAWCQEDPPAQRVRRSRKTSPHAVQG